MMDRATKTIKKPTKINRIGSNMPERFFKAESTSAS
jgi:hypothetical protein